MRRELEAIHTGGKVREANDGVVGAEVQVFNSINIEYVDRAFSQLWLSECIQCRPVEGQSAAVRRAVTDGRPICINSNAT